MLSICLDFILAVCGCCQFVQLDGDVSAMGVIDLLSFSLGRLPFQWGFLAWFVKKKKPKQSQERLVKRFIYFERKLHHALFVLSYALFSVFVFCYNFLLTSLNAASVNNPKNFRTKSSLVIKYSPFFWCEAYFWKTSRNLSVLARFRNEGPCKRNRRNKQSEMSE